MGDLWDIGLLALTLVLAFLPAGLARWPGIRLTKTMTALWLVFLVGSEIFGEMLGFYQKFRLWDVALHGISGILSAGIGFALAGQEKPGRGLTAVCFAVTVGTVWELFEWSADLLLGLDMQKDTVIHQIQTILRQPMGIRGIRETVLVTQSGQTLLGLGGYLDIGLHDTMSDLAVTMLGALALAGLECFDRKTGRCPLVRKLIPKRMK